jgi:uncharacterized protein (DUF1499 family)
MRLLPLLLSLVFPLCGTEGIDGMPAPPPMDIAHIERPSTPNTFLAAPADFTPKPDAVTDFHGDPDQLYAAVKRVALAQDRVYLHVAYDDRRQVHFVARSANANFPDLITAQITPDGNLILYSRSIYGHGDMGVNQTRVHAWLAALAAR